MSSSEDDRRRLADEDHRRKLTAESDRRLKLEKERKEVEKYNQKRKALQAEQGRVKAKGAEEQEKRQDAANRALNEMMGQTLREEGEGLVGGPRIFGSSSLKGSLLGGMGGASSPRESVTRDRSSIKAPPGATIPGLDQARAEREKQSKYLINEGGRFTSNTSTGKGSTGATAATSSILRKGIRF
jgi:hypothetical protein